MTRATEQAARQQATRTWMPAAPARAEPALVLRGVGRTWRAGRDGCSATVRALRGVDLEVHAGELLALAGAPGAGKTTLLLCAAGLAHADEGVVRGSAGGRVAYVGGGLDGAWIRAALAAVARGARALLLDVIDAPALASPRAVAALAGSIASSGLAVVVAARDPRHLPAFAHRLVVLDRGRVMRSGSPLASLRADGMRCGGNLGGGRGEGGPLSTGGDLRAEG